MRNSSFGAGLGWSVDGSSRGGDGPSAGSLPVRDTLAGREVLVTGVTGFLGKVWLAHLLYEVPSVRRVWVLLRGKGEQSAAERWREIAERSPVFRPLRARHGASFGAFLRARIGLLEGDCAEPWFGLSPEVVDALAPRLSAVVHFAGMVDFEPDPVAAVAANVDGALHAAELVERCDRAVLLHCSTCFVAGAASGDVAEQVTPGVSPNGSVFDPAAVTEDLRGVPGTDKASRRVAGLEIARGLGWPNIYTVTKGLAEHLLAQRRAEGATISIVRPSVVECAQRFPFAGWNEGINTTGPLMWVCGSWLRHIPMGSAHRFDIIPVDAVARGTTVALAATLRGESALVYQLASSQFDALTFDRGLELNNLGARADRQRKGKPGAALLRHWDAVAVPDPNHLLAPAGLRKLTGRLGRALHKVAEVELSERLPPAWYRAFGETVEEHLSLAAAVVDNAERTLGRLERMFESYRPFVLDYDYRFLADHIRGLAARLPDSERDAFGWEGDGIDWHHYYLKVLYPGLHTWSIPLLFGKEVPRDPAPPEGIGAWSVLGAARPESALELALGDESESPPDVRAEAEVPR